MPSIAACAAYRHPKRMITNTSDGAHHDRMTAALEAAMPVIRKQLTDEIRDIEPDRAMFNQMVRDHSVDYGNGYTDGIHAAARIAEGDQK